MKCVIVHESMFGNTTLVAEAVRDAFVGAGADVVSLDVRDATPADLAGCDVLVVGAPTHAFSLSRPTTRRDAISQGAEPARAAIGVREWLGLLDGAFPEARLRPLAAVFDTRVDRVRRLPGSAARRAARALRAEGFRIALEPVSFYVEDVKGPPAPGELARARAWGERLAEVCRVSGRRPPGTPRPAGPPG